MLVEASEYNAKVVAVDQTYSLQTSNMGFYSMQLPKLGSARVGPSEISTNVLVHISKLDVYIAGLSPRPKPQKVTEKPQAKGCGRRGFQRRRLLRQEPHHRNVSCTGSDTLKPGPELSITISNFKWFCWSYLGLGLGGWWVLAAMEPFLLLL